MMLWRCRSQLTTFRSAANPRLARMPPNRHNRSGSFLKTSKCLLKGCLSLLFPASVVKVMRRFVAHSRPASL